MSLVTLLQLVGGLVGLVVGGELLVRGASRLATLAGVSALVVGLTVVALGTSAPELVVSIKAVLSGAENIAVANVVGSNIFNVLFILGVCALLSPLVVKSQLVRIDVPIMIATSFALLLFAQNGTISLVEGALLFLGILSYVVLQIVQGRKEGAQTSASSEEKVSESKGLVIAKNLFYLALGLALLIYAGGEFVTGAITLAQSLGVSDTVIGLTIVAAGTSLPEVVTSIIATIKGERDIAIGNVIGSNIFNILGILGATTFFSKTGLLVNPDMISVDIPVMILVAVACLPIFWSGFTIGRFEGFILLAAYVVYTVFLVLNAQNHALNSTWSQFILYGFLPLTLIVLLFLSFKIYKQHRTANSPSNGLNSGR